MLEIIGLKKFMTELILSYFKKKCEKEFIDYETLKTLLIQFSKESKSQYLMLFNIISFPNYFISFKDLEKFIQELKFQNNIDLG